MKSITKSVLALLSLAAMSTSSWAVAYNDEITAIFGGGNPDSGWTSDTNNGIELGLRAKNRTSGSTANVDGVYSFATAPATRGLFNYEFSINSGSSALDQYDFYLAADSDASQGVSYSYVNALTHWFDNSYGDAGTANGGGEEALLNLSMTPAQVAAIMAGLAADNSIAQNSQNITFGDYPGGGLALVPDATYNYQLFAVAKGAGVDGARLANVEIVVNVGAGGAPAQSVPDSGATLALLGLGLAGLVVFNMKKRALLA